jgi:hypothetical protein
MSEQKPYELAHFWWTPLYTALLLSSGRQVSGCFGRSVRHLIYFFGS